MRCFIIIPTTNRKSFKPPFFWWRTSQVISETQKSIINFRDLSNRNLLTAALPNVGSWTTVPLGLWGEAIEALTSMEWRKRSASTCSSCWPALVTKGNPLGWFPPWNREWNEVGYGRMSVPMLWVMRIMMIICNCCHFDRLAFWWYIVG